MSVPRRAHSNPGGVCTRVMYFRRGSDGNAHPLAMLEWPYHGLVNGSPLTAVYRLPRVRSNHDGSCELTETGRPSQWLTGWSRPMFTAPRGRCSNHDGKSGSCIRLISRIAPA